MKFHGYYRTVKAIEHSGWSCDDNLRASLSSFAEVEGYEFDHYEVWDYLLQTVPKFVENLIATPAKSKRQTDTIESTIRQPLQRPVGTKRTIDMTSPSIDSQLSQNEFQNQFIAEQRRRTEAIEQKSAIALFAAQSGELDAESQEPFRLKRKLEMKRLQKWLKTKHVPVVKNQIML
ncbi:hypothetical protein AC1031_010310 [Aphanomyces cochlioides]|nr:hypothetical protein AC1031_010310 [Aphanomyces cochlioides]